MGQRRSTNPITYSYEEAKAWLGQRTVRTQAEFARLAKEKQLPDGFPSAPRQYYQRTGEWISWPSFLGSDRRSRRSCPASYSEASAWARSNRVLNGPDWRRRCNMGEIPDRFPASPDTYYGRTGEWESWQAFLGYGEQRRRRSRPFIQARDYARSLGLKSRAEWQAWCSSGSRPNDIPSRPEQAYGDEWRGISDWLGCSGILTRPALRALLMDLRRLSSSLAESELVDLLRAAGAFPRVMRLLGVASPLRALKRLSALTDAEISQAVKAGPFDHHEDDEADSEHLLSEVVDDIDDSLSEPALSNEYLDGPDRAAAIADSEQLDEMIANRVDALWEEYANHGPQRVAEWVGKESPGPYRGEIVKRFSERRERVERFAAPHGWSFQLDGKPVGPNLMQRWSAICLVDERRTANWSRAGAGKTIAAILGSRAIDARVTVVVAANATLDGWREQLLAAYPDSVLYDVDGGVVGAVDRNRHTYALLNYEKLSHNRRHEVAAKLLSLAPDFFVLDEVQFVKHRAVTSAQSARRRVLADLIAQAEDCNPELAVLGMSATPVINSLREGIALAELITGEPLDRLSAVPTVSNALALHRELRRIGIRFKPDYAIDLDVEPVRAVRNELAPDVRSALATPLRLERLLAPAKLELVADRLRPGTVVYSHYVTGILPLVQKAVVARGLRVATFSGNESRAARRRILDDFAAGRVDVLVGTSAMATGLDGLQMTADRLIMLGLPWTGAEYEQVIGRLYRQGSAARRVEVIIPQIVFDHEGERWSYDEMRLRAIESKRTLADCVLDGRVPTSIGISQTKLLAKLRDALDQWLEQLEREDAA